MMKEVLYEQLREAIFSWYDFKIDGLGFVLNADENKLMDLWLRRLDKVFAAVDAKKKKQFSEKYKDANNLYIIQTDELCKLEKNCFDYIIAYHSLDFTDNESEALDLWMEYLKPEGHLLLVVENRYGLKYFCGARDPYTGVCYDGVNNYLKGASKNGRCYSRAQLEDIIKGLGSINYKFYYPVPDSSMPQLIFSDNYMDGINAFERLVDYDYQDENMVGVEHRIFGEMINSGSLPFMSNSFLVDITREGELSDIDYAVITADRGKEAGFATTIRNVKGDNAIVKKRPLWPDGANGLRKLHENTVWLKKHDVPVVETTLLDDGYGLCLCMKYCKDEGLTDVLKKLVTNDKEQFLAIFDKIYEYIYKASGKDIEEQKKYKNDKEVILEECYLDLAPCNSFYDSETGKIIFYDQEFTLQNCPAKFAMFRTLKYFYASAVFTDDEIPLADMYNRYGITRDQIEEYEEREKVFIEGLRNTNQYQQIFKWATPSYDEIYHRMKVISNISVDSKKPYRIGYVPGVYDLFHVGHLRLFERCKERCDYLIVGVLTDELVEYYKHKKPVISYENRAGVIKGLKVVDEVIPVDFSNTDKIKAWEMLHYDCHFSGDDHVGHWNDVMEELRKRGSNMEFFTYTEGISSTQIRKKMQE